MKEISVISLMRSGHHGVINWILRQIDGSYLFINELFNPKFRKFRLTYKPDYFIYNFEDCSLNETKKFLETPPLEILVLRDPYNLFASRKKIADNPDFYSPLGWTSQEAIDIWKEHAREFLNTDKITVNFNKWFSDVCYRKQLSEKLNLCYKDKGLNVISSFGGGSSFDGTRKKGQKMNVLHRYTTKCFDEEVTALSKEIFG